MIVLFALLVRYRTVTLEAARSAQLAKNVWDAMNSRLQVMDARIIDVMAKVEVLSSRGVIEPRTRSEVTTPSGGGALASSVQEAVPAAPQARAPAEASHDIEGTILRLLLEAPRTSSDIMRLVNRSREHTSRVMKALFDGGLVTRDNRNRPFVYAITDTGRRYIEAK